MLLADPRDLANQLRNDARLRESIVDTECQPLVLDEHALPTTRCRVLERRGRGRDTRLERRDVVARPRGFAGMGELHPVIADHPSTVDAGETSSISRAPARDEDDIDTRKCGQLVQDLLRLHGYDRELRSWCDRRECPVDVEKQQKRISLKARRERRSDRQRRHRHRSVRAGVRLDVAG